MAAAVVAAVAAEPEPEFETEIAKSLAVAEQVQSNPDRTSHVSKTTQIQTKKTKFAPTREKKRESLDHVERSFAKKIDLPAEQDENEIENESEWPNIKLGFDKNVELLLAMLNNQHREKQTSSFDLCAEFVKSLAVLTVIFSSREWDQDLFVIENWPHHSEQERVDLAGLVHVYMVNPHSSANLVLRHPLKPWTQNKVNLPLLRKVFEEADNFLVHTRDNVLALCLPADVPEDQMKVVIEAALDAGFGLDSDRVFSRDLWEHVILGAEVECLSVREQFAFVLFSRLY